VKVCSNRRKSETKKQIVITTYSSGDVQSFCGLELSSSLSRSVRSITTGFDELLPALAGTGLKMGDITVELPCFLLKPATIASGPEERTG
jgi:hypothetical protein